MSLTQASSSNAGKSEIIQDLIFKLDSLGFLAHLPNPIYVDNPHRFWYLDLSLGYLPHLITQPFYPCLIPERS